MRALRLLQAPPPAASPPDTPLPDLGALPRLGWIDKNCFAIDESYQREPGTRAGEKVIARIVATFTWRKFQPPTVVQVDDGRFVAIDGQHRIIAAQRHPAVRDIPCYIVDAQEISDQADAFVSINRDRIPLNSLQLHHAAVAAGNPDALRMQKLCEDAGVIIPRTLVSTLAKKPNQLLGVGHVTRLLAVYGEKPLSRALKVMVAARCEVRKGALGGVTQFFAAYRRHAIDEQRLIRVLEARPAAKLEAGGRAWRDAHPGTKIDVATRMALVAEYNRGLPVMSDKLPERP